MSLDALAPALDCIRRAQAGQLASDSDLVADAVDVVVAATAETYAQQSAGYAALRGYETTKCEEYMTAKLLGTVRASIASGRLPGLDAGRWRLLDLGAGHGRDLLRFLTEPDIIPVGVENASGFAAILHKLERERHLPPGCVVVTDMRDLSLLADATFQCVRSHAALHHLPALSGAVGADQAVAEGRRVLVRGGILYIVVKAGQGVQVIDTREGLGPRFFQLFTPRMLTDMLRRHRFDVLHLEARVSERATGPVDWLFCLARAH